MDKRSHWKTQQDRELCGGPSERYERAVRRETGELEESLNEGASPSCTLSAASSPSPDVSSLLPSSQLEQNSFRDAHAGRPYSPAPLSSPSRQAGGEVPNDLEFRRGKGKMRRKG